MKITFQSRCVLLCLALVGGLSVLSARLVQIQLVDRKHLEAKARKTYFRPELLPAIRGMIVDRHEEPLARSMPVVSFYVDRKHLEDPKLAAYCLAYQEAALETDWASLSAKEQSQRVMSVRRDILRNEDEEVIVRKHLAFAVGVLARPLGMRREELLEKITANRKQDYFPIAKDLPQDVAEQLQDIIEGQRIQGISPKNSIKRWYPAPSFAAHVVGFTNEVDVPGKDGKPYPRVKGVYGVESSMDEYLTGRDGWREHMRDARGLVVPGNPDDLTPPRAGLNVKLTLDMGIQAIVEEELDAGLAQFKTHRGTVILMDPMTGEILAMASRPNFNLNLREGLGPNGNGASVNYAIQTVYEPGSTIKIVATSGALNEGLVTPQSSINCYNGFYQGRGYSVRDDYPAGHLTFEGVLLKSNNNGTCSIGRQLGSKKFYDYLRNYGFGRKTGIQLSGERGGVARNTNNEADFSRACFGYATNVTPLQLACAYSVIAGDGKLRKPHIVRSVVANDGSVIQDYPPEVVREVLKPRSAAQMRGALEKVTLKGGTATRAAVPGFLVAGKTGTVQKHNPGGGYLKNRYIASFAGMMPAQKPAFVCVVVIDDPRTETHGGTVAAPIFSKIASRVATHLNLQPTEPLPPPVTAAK